MGRRRDDGGRITERLTTYGFPNGTPRDGSHFKDTTYAYGPEGWLQEMTTTGALASGNYNDDQNLTRVNDLGTLETIVDDSGHSVWHMQRHGDGRIQHVLGQNNLMWGLDYDHQGRIVEKGPLKPRYDSFTGVLCFQFLRHDLLRSKFSVSQIDGGSNCAILNS